MESSDTPADLETQLQTIYGWPPALAKAACDPFSYAMGLKTGEVILFSEALPSPCKRWAHLTGQNVQNGLVVSMTRATYDRFDDLERDLKNINYVAFSRGIDIDIDSIAWCADCPEGS